MSALTQYKDFFADRNWNALYSEHYTLLVFCLDLTGPNAQHMLTHAVPYVLAATCVISRVIGSRSMPRWES